MNFRMFKKLHICFFSLLLAGTFLSAGCTQKNKGEKSQSTNMTQPKNTSADLPSVVVIMKSKSQSKANGTIALTETDSGLRLKGTIKGLDANSGHALHFHEKGSCKGDGAKGAGGHFNPDNEKHGALSDKKHHAGDLGNYFSNSDGEIKVDKTFSHLKLTEGDKAVINRSMVLHAKKDDFTSQPSGAAGKRIACGVVPKIK